MEGIIITILVAMLTIGVCALLIIANSDSVSLPSSSRAIHSTVEQKAKGQK